MSRTVVLRYGREGLPVDLDDDATVVRPPRVEPAAPAPRLLAEALARPRGAPRLAEATPPGARVAVAVCDGTRPQPRPVMLRALLDELADVRDARVTVIVATGTHRASTRAELVEMLGADVLRRVRVVDHDARDPAGLVDMGTVGEVPVQLNREWVEADVRVTTGFVEPHMFAGFSGGPKLVAPGLAGVDTTRVLHDARRIGHPHARWGVRHGNPVHDDVRAIAAATGVTLALDVVVDRDHRVVAAVAGEVLQMHDEACRLARGIGMVPVDGLADVVVTTGGGHPLDQNLYQSVKGMAAAAEVVRPGGAIVCATRCADGVPAGGGYEALLRRHGVRGLDSLLAARGETEVDQWQVQVQSRVLDRASVAVYSEGLTDDDLRLAGMSRCRDVADHVRRLRARSPAATVCVLTDGPFAVPVLPGDPRTG